MSKLLLALDPSYKRTGISLYYKGKIFVSEVKGLEVLGRESFSKTFNGIHYESEVLCNYIEDEINRLMAKADYSYEGGILISECPPPQGSYAPGLYALDTRLFSMYKRLRLKVYQVYPNYLMHIHQMRKYPKSKSVDLAKEILSNYDTTIVSKRLSHDESESVIFLSRLLYIEDLLPESIVERVPNIRNTKEILFEYR